MSTCPEKDIHSVYLDGELPEAYEAEYKAHLDSCPECKKQLESLKMLKAIFEADKKSMELSEKDMEDSFERLQARLSFSKHTKSNVVEFKPKPFISAAIGAVAALAIVFIPARLSATKQASSLNTAAFTPVANSDIVSPASILVKQVDGEISSSSIANLLSGGETFVGNNEVLLNTFNSNFGTVSYPAARHRAANKHSGRRADAAKQLASYDIFTPVPGRSSESSWTADEDESTVEFSLGSVYLNTQGE